MVVAQNDNEVNVRGCRVKIVGSRVNHNAFDARLNQHLFQVAEMDRGVVLKDEGFLGH